MSALASSRLLGSAYGRLHHENQSFGHFARSGYTMTADRYWEGRWRDEYARAERLRLALEEIGWMDEFLDADGAKAMMKIARSAVNADAAPLPSPQESGPNSSGDRK